MPNKFLMPNKFVLMPNKFLFDAYPLRGRLRIENRACLTG